MKKLSKIPYGKNVYDQREIKAVIKTLNKSTQMGESVNTFEKKISKLFSKKYGKNSLTQYWHRPQRKLRNSL